MQYKVRFNVLKDNRKFSWWPEEKYIWSILVKICLFLKTVFKFQVLGVPKVCKMLLEFPTDVVNCKSCSWVN